MVTILDLGSADTDGAGDSRLVVVECGIAGAGYYTADGRAESWVRRLQVISERQKVAVALWMQCAEPGWRDRLGRVDVGEDKQSGATGMVHSGKRDWE